MINLVVPIQLCSEALEIIGELYPEIKWGNGMPLAELNPINYLPDNIYVKLYTDENFLYLTPYKKSYCNYNTLIQEAKEVRMCGD